MDLQIHSIPQVLMKYFLSFEVYCLECEEEYSTGQSSVQTVFKEDCLENGGGQRDRAILQEEWRSEAWTDFKKLLIFKYFSFS